MADKDDTAKPKPHPLAHVPVADLTKLPPEDVQAERGALAAIKRANEILAKKPHLN